MTMGSASRRYDILKRLLDVFGASFGLVVSLPVQALVGALVATKLGRPVLFRQTRPGRGGRPFTLLKFRTMKQPDPARGLVSDADRLTRFGALLRSTSLDELPTLLNVIKGDMSIVGPRPLLMSYLDRYTSEQARRHEVRPGVTGLAQVNGRNAIEWERKLALDVEYVERRSLTLDASIVFLTVARVLRRDGISADGHVSAPEFRPNNGASFSGDAMQERTEQLDETEFVALVEDILEVAPGTVDPTDRLEDIDWDSLANLGLMAELDGRFGVNLGADEIAACETISDLYEAVNSVVAQR